jgi:hypothetical protein
VAAPEGVAAAGEGLKGGRVGLLILEALLALALFVFIVWWVMFAGRRQGERPDDPPPP